MIPSMLFLMNPPLSLIDPAAVQAEIARQSLPGDPPLVAVASGPEPAPVAAVLEVPALEDGSGVDRAFAAAVAAVVRRARHEGRGGRARISLAFRCSFWPDPA